MYVKLKYVFLSRKKRVLLRKYQEIKPIFISYIGLYHAHEMYMMNDVWSGPSYQHYRSAVKAMHWGSYLYKYTQE